MWISVFLLISVALRVNLPDKAPRYFHGICSYRPEIKHNKALVQCSALSNLCEAVQTVQSARVGETLSTLCFLQPLRDGTKCSTWREGSILKYSTAAALTACLSPRCLMQQWGKSKHQLLGGLAHVNLTTVSVIWKILTHFLRSRFSASYPSILLQLPLRLMSAPQLYLKNTSCRGLQIARKWLVFNKAIDSDLSPVVTCELFK